MKIILYFHVEMMITQNVVINLKYYYQNMKILMKN